MTRLAVTIVQILDPQTKPGDVLAAAQERLTQDAEAKALFERCYQIADRFMFTPDFLEQRKVRWLGGVEVSHGGHPCFARSDYFMIQNGFHRTTSIHHHLAFSQPVDLHSWDSEEWRSCIYALHELYWSWNWAQDRRTDDSHVGDLLDPFLRVVEPPHAAQFASRGFYISLYDANPALIADWESVAPALTSLLYLHAEGFDQAHAAQALAARTAQSTEFFISFYNADAILSLSRTYPGPGLVEPFAADYPTTPGTIAATQTAFEQRLQQHRQRYEPYDLLPEYPALRYLDVGLTEFTTNTKSSQWNIRHRLDSLSQANGVSRVPRTAIALPGVDRTYYRSIALFVLRLPAARDLAKKLIAEQAPDLNQEAIDGMKSSLLNTLVTVLTAGALLVAVVQLVLAFR